MEMGVALAPRLQYVGKSPDIDGLGTSPDIDGLGMSPDIDGLRTRSREYIALARPQAAIPTTN